MAEFTQGDIVWVQFPLSDKPGKLKFRPAIVVSNTKSNRLDNDLLIAQITSQLRDDPFCYRIHNEHLEGEIPTISEIRCNKLATIRSSLIFSKLATLKPANINEVIKLVSSSILND